MDPAREPYSADVRSISGWLNNASKTSSAAALTSNEVQRDVDAATDEIIQLCQEFALDVLDVAAIASLAEVYMVRRLQERHLTDIPDDKLAEVKQLMLPGDSLEKIRDFLAWHAIRTMCDDSIAEMGRREPISTHERRLACLMLVRDEVTGDRFDLTNNLITILRQKIDLLAAL